MRNLVLAAVGAAALGVLAVPATAQVGVDVGRGGVGLQVGPLGAGVGERYRDHRRDYRRGPYARAECRTIRERIERPSGRVIHRTKKICD